MRHLRRGLSLLSLFMVAPLSAQAGDFYGGVAAGATTYEETGFEFKAGTVTGKLGYRLNDLLAAEVHAGISGSDTANGITMNMNYLTSAFLRADWSPVSDGRIRLYLMGGYSAADLEFDNGSSVLSSTESGASYAVGLDLYANRKHGVAVQWSRYLDDTLRGADYSLDGLSLGYFRYF